MIHMQSFSVNNIVIVTSAILNQMSRKRCIPLLDSIRINRLPTELQVLGHLLWLHKQEPALNRSRQKIAIKVAHAIKDIWDAAYINSGRIPSIMRQLFSGKRSLFNR